MKKYQDGEWTVLEEETRKPFELVKVDAARPLASGLSGLVTIHEWKGNKLEVKSIGSDATLEFEPGKIICRIRFRSAPSTIPFVRKKILSDVEAAVREVSGIVDSTNKNVFIVHGHHQEAKVELRNFLAKLGLNPIILEEQDDRGMTIIEMFEYYACLCSFAFILVTPDDRTSAVESADQPVWRARQNVLMELGWFIGRVGRDHVAILYKEGAEIPSDIHGVLYARFDKTVLEASEKIRQRLKGVNLIG